jgi:bifunctional non-homologous end joining protein LigD
VAQASASVEVEVEGRTLKVSNLDKVLWPATGFTKGQVIDYYTRIAPALLPHMRERPLTLKRYPNGVDAPFFYEKQCPKHRPDWVAVAPLWASGRGRWGTAPKEGKGEKIIEYCLCNDLPTLVWIANLASLELHTSLSLASKIEQPTMVVFDLDPGPPAGVVECARVALWLRGVLDDLGLQSVIKTSGSKGLQLYVPLNTDGVTYEQTKPFSQALAQLLEREHPDSVVSTQDKSKRPGKVLIDWLQNDGAKTTVCVYSLRARERPTVSTPVTWDEVAAAADAADAGLLVFEAGDVLKRFEAKGDLFTPAVELVQPLPSLSA